MAPPNSLVSNGTFSQKDSSFAGPWLIMADGCVPVAPLLKTTVIVPRESPGSTVAVMSGSKKPSPGKFPLPLLQRRSYTALIAWAWAAAAHPRTARATTAVASLRMV